MKKVKLPTGAELGVVPAPFEESKALYQVMAAEATHLQIDPSQKIDANFWKDIACTALASPQIEEKLWVCMERCTYNGKRITKATFEPVEARDDYFTVMFEVAQENVHPFTKSLYVKYADIIGALMQENPA